MTPERAKAILAETGHDKRCQRMQHVASLGAPYGNCTCDHALRAILAAVAEEREDCRKAVRTGVQPLIGALEPAHARDGFVMLKAAHAADTAIRNRGNDNG